jgi:hypothetical protein
MKSLWQEEVRREIAARVGRITDETKPLWGKMTADRMLAHLGEAVKMATGELPVKPKNTPLRFFPLKHLAIYVLPMPKGLPTAPELLAGPQAPVADGKRELQRALETFANRRPDAVMPPHPVFGNMSRFTWGVQAYRHIDHHLRQFGV